MNRKLVFVVLEALVALMVGVAGTIAQEPDPVGGTDVKAAVGTAFTFQGHLEDSGGPLNDTCDFEFELYDAAAAGSQVGATLTENSVAVSDGKFNLLLDFGSGVFYGEARYLQIAVRCSGDPAFVDLSGRVALTATPHALSLMPRAQVLAATSNMSLLTLRNLSSTGYGPALYATTASTSTQASAVHGAVTHSLPGHLSAGIRGTNSGTQGSGAGVWGSHAAAGKGVYGSATSGIGVFGEATSGIAFNYGVYGQSLSANGIGTFGRHVSQSGTAPGVMGETHSTSDEAAGVLGQVTSTSPGTNSAGVRGVNEGTGTSGIGVYGSQAGSGWGVYGTAPDGIGVYGVHTNTIGTEPGVKGETLSTDYEATAVLGQVTATSPGSMSAGVRGVNEGTGATGIGVYGSQAGSGTGVYGTTPEGVGVYGVHTDQSGHEPGVKGETWSEADWAAGVLGRVTAVPLGSYSAGVRGISSGTGMISSGVHGQADSGWGVYGIASDGIGVFGLHYSGSGTEPGVKGETNSASNSAVGVLGRVTSTTPGSYSTGVRGINEGTGGFGIGVYGSQEGGGWGVYGTTPDGIGVYGLHDGTTGTEPGVKGETDSTDASAVGVLGRVTSTSPGPSSAGVQGLNEGTSTQGIGVHGEHMGGGWGVYGVSNWGDAGYFSGDVTVTGTCTGCTLAYIGINDGHEPLETGDLVTVSGVSDPLAGMTTPLLRLRRVDANNAAAVVGVVQSRAQLAGRQNSSGRALDNVVRAEGPAAPGDHLFIVVQGMVQVKADAGQDTIQAGDDLAVLGTLASHAGRVSENNESRRIGRAMENLDQGVGLIWVMVDLH